MFTPPQVHTSPFTTQPQQPFYQSSPQTPLGGPSTYRQPRLTYSSSPGTPTMTALGTDHSALLRGGSPSSPYISPSTSSYQSTSNSGYNNQHIPRQQPQSSYMSPVFSNQFENLTTSAGTPPTYLSQSTYNQQGPIDQHQQPHVTIYDFSPQEGNQGSQIVIKCDVQFPPSPSSSKQSSPSNPNEQSALLSRGRALRVVFGNYPVPTSVHILSNSGDMSIGQMCHLSATAPNWSNTGSTGVARPGRVPVYVQVLTDSSILETVMAGEFTYYSLGSGKGYTNLTQSNPLKRAGQELESSRPSPNHFLHRRVLSNNVKLESPEMTQYSQFQQTYHPTPGQVSDSYSSPYIQSGAVVTQSQAAPYPGGPATQPSLMRSTQVFAPVGPTGGPSPYVLTCGNKAHLEMVGNLDEMARGWTQDEWMNRRRLVQFWRRQEGTTISAAFRPLPQSEYPQQQQSIIVSCIFREDKNACYVTSVDTIYLLEALVGSRFTVEEKNRIRRNLEGFRPQTVSKSKAGSEDFFKLIMGFPNPKPRNIEKDVKVFPWDILGHALKKIIGKYSASYPYASSAMSTPTGNAQPQLPLPYPIQPMEAATQGSRDMYGPPPVTIPTTAGSGSAPTLLSHSSSDSSTYAELPPHSYPPMNDPQTPQMSQSHSHPHSQVPSPSDHYRQVSNSSNSSLKHHDTHEYVNLSPANDSPYSSSTSHPSYWSGMQGSLSGGMGMNMSVGVGQNPNSQNPGSNPSGHGLGIGIGVGGGGAGHDQALPSPAISSGSYATLPGPMTYPDQPHQLPHVHETLNSKGGSSSDLRVMYATSSN